MRPEEDSAPSVARPPLILSTLSFHTAALGQIQDGTLGTDAHTDLLWREVRNMHISHVTKRMQSWMRVTASHLYK